jgi:hypothetical protein
VILSRLERPGEALFAHLATSAHLLGLLHLEEGRTGVADREEQLWILVEARRAVAPIHGGELLIFAEAADGWVGKPCRCTVTAFLL